MKQLLTGLLVVITLAGCQKDQLSTVYGDWLFPIAKGSISLYTLKELRNLQYDIDIPALSIGQPVGIPISAPGLQIDHVGPFAVQISPWLHRMDIDTLEFSGSLHNIFPIPIGAGTRISMRRTRDTAAGNIVGSTTVLTNVPPGSLFSFNIRVMNKTIGDSVYFFLDNFTSPPYNNVVFTNASTQLSIKLKVITASYVEAYTGKTFSSIDTSDFSTNTDDQLSNGTGGTLSDTGVSGYINVFADNKLPANVTFQLYFMNEGKTAIIDSLFISRLMVGGAMTDFTGMPLNTVSTAEKVLITRKKINNMKKARYAITDFRVNTNGYLPPVVRANKQAKLDIQLTGDLNLKISF